jgi:hypothetical protein
MTIAPASQRLLTTRIEQGAFPWQTTPRGKVVLSPA